MKSLKIFWQTVDMPHTTVMKKLQHKTLLLTCLIRNMKTGKKNKKIYLTETTFTTMLKRIITSALMGKHSSMRMIILLKKENRNREYIPVRNVQHVHENHNAPNQTSAVYT